MTELDNGRPHKTKETNVTRPAKKRKLAKEGEGSPAKKKTNNVKTDKLVPTEQLKNVVPVLTKKAKKRPWRQITRRKAKRERKIAAGLIDPKPSEDGHKKKKRKKKKEKDNKDKVAEDKEVTTVKEGNEKTKQKKEEKMTPGEKLSASRFRFLNEQLYTTTSKDAEKLFKEDPSAFDAYHKGYEAQLKKWPANPLENIIMDLETLSDGSVIADMGCGTAQIAQKLGKKMKVHSFDLVAANEYVTPCSITKTPLEDNSADVVVFCLSLMGTNLSDFIREANRILKQGGKLKIAEVMSRFRHVKNFIRAVEQMGFDMKKKRDLNDFFVLLTFTKTGKVKQKRPTGLILEPCLYKKR